MKQWNGLSCLVVPLACALLTMPAAARAGLVDYNAPGDLAANFSLNHAGAGNKYSEVASGGLGGSRAIASGFPVDAVHTTALFDQNNFSFANVGDSVTMSQFVLRQDDAGFPFEFSFMQLGILQNATGRLGIDIGTDSYVSLRVLSDTVSPTGVFLQTEVKGSGDSARTQQNTTGQSADLTAGHWYRLTATFENLSSTDVRITGALEDWGATGSAFQSTILELLGSNPQSTVDLSGLAGSTVLSDGQVWGGWRGFAEGGGALYDNFSIVPEPTTLGLFATGVFMLLRRRRSMR
jgi:hypothetical protein